MTIWRGLILIAIATIAPAPQGPPGPPAPQVYRTQTDVVVIDAAVRDGRKVVTTLAREDFELRDNGVVQQILDFDRETLPIDLTVVIDVSGSMKPADRAVIERAIGQVRGTLRPADRLAMLMFGSHIIERTPLQPPSSPVALSGTAGTVGTAVTDALLLALVTPPALDRRQLVLFMTDGADNASFFDARTVMDTAPHASATLSVVLVPNRASGAAERLFRTVTSITGGQVIELDSNDDLSQAFLVALDTFRTSYVLRYSPTGVSAAGWHDVRVTVKSRRYEVRARKGYWAAR